MRLLLSCLARPSVLCLFFVLAAASACKPSRSGQTAGGNPMDYFKEAYTGYNQTGSTESCFKKTSAEPCPQPSSSDLEFAAACKARNYELYECSCNHTLCSQNPFDLGAVTNSSSGNAKNSSPLYTGYDYSGVKRNCKPMDPATACTQIFGPADQFAIDCEKAGFRYYQCACHDYLCAADLSKRQSPLVE